jgi:hypothetical protein
MVSKLGKGTHICSNVGQTITSFEVENSSLSSALRSIPSAMMIVAIVEAVLDLLGCDIEVDQCFSVVKFCF